MAQRGLDESFGLRGTSTSHVSGFGGSPLGVVVGVGGRPTLVCSAPDQRLPDQQLTPGPRLRAAPLETPRVVSFPVDGRGPVEVSGPAADEQVTLVRAAARPDRIAVLGSVGASGERPVVQTFHPTVHACPG